MGQEPIMFRALRQQLLWPSIHQAVDVYQRRRACNADYYELVWRLIHIWECTAITLAGAAIASIRPVEIAKSEYLRLRERCYGITWSDAEDTLVRGQGALDGSVDKWIEILQLIANTNLEGTRFLRALVKFLGKDADTPAGYGIDLAPLARAWSRACDVPPSVRPQVVPVREAIQAINVFRNRFAHVPFPYDQLQDVSREIEECTFRLFDVQSPTASEESCLTGCFAYKDHLLRGAGFDKTPDGWNALEHESFVWGKKGDQETWEARPFVLLDKMMRPYLLTRLKNEAGWWEYTRYLAEANAVASVTNPELLKLLPRPSEDEYARKPEGIIADDRVEIPEPVREITVASRDEAMAAIREGHFQPAVDYFRQEVKGRPSYHSGWQRLGVTQREWAVRIMDSDPQKAAELLKDSLDSFRHATGHIDSQYAAEAYYNRSKAHWRLWQLTNGVDHLRYCVRDAEEAAKRHFEERFISWLEFVKENCSSLSVNNGAGSQSTKIDAPPITNAWGPH
ncbi:MAG TPA: hypothetical protein VNY05_39105 [Candidatus Acidoferrales bacterium]|nr:hypothetical protein [Candidatus Acidoferrales bacterium]